MNIYRAYEGLNSTLLLSADVRIVAGERDGVCLRADRSGFVDAHGESALSLTPDSLLEPSADPAEESIASK